MDATGTAAVITAPMTIVGIGTVGGFVSPNDPNLTDFRNFLATSVEIPGNALPSTSPWPGYALNQALILVPNDIQVGIIYTLAVYNCATHLLLSITPDQPGQNYFTTARSRDGFNLINPTTGIIVSTSDNGTSATNTAPQWASELTLSQLGYYKTPWGRAYLEYVQAAGPYVFGLT